MLKLPVALTAALFLGSAVFAQEGAIPNTYTDYTFAQNGPFNNLEMNITWEESPTCGAVYPAFGFSFQASAGGYIGAQLVSTTHKALFSIWDSGPYTQSAQPHPSTPQCHRFGHEGTGTMCLIDYEWIVGREYTLMVSPYAALPTGGEDWRGEITDTVTGQSTLIGRIRLKNSNGFRGYGRLNNRAYTFTEYFGSGWPHCARPTNSCDPQPTTRVVWRGPSANNHRYYASGATNNYNACLNSEVHDRGFPAVVQSQGTGVVRKTKPGTVLWRNTECK